LFIKHGLAQAYVDKTKEINIDKIKGI